MVYFGNLSPFDDTMGKMGVHDDAINDELGPQRDGKLEVIISMTWWENWGLRVLCLWWRNG